MRSCRVGPFSGVVVPRKGWIEDDGGCMKGWLGGMVAHAEPRVRRYKCEVEERDMLRSMVLRA